MKLTFCCQLFYPELVSTGLTLTELCEALSKQGHTITVYCAPPTVLHKKEKVPAKLIYKGINIERVWTFRFPKLFFWGKLFNHISFFISLFFKCLTSPKHTHYVMLTNPPFLPFLTLFLSPFKRFTYSVLVFDVYPETLTAAKVMSSSDLIYRCWQSLNKKVYSKAQYIFTIGRCMQAVLKEQLPASIHNKLKLIDIWADAETIQFSRGSKEFRQLWNLESKFIVGYSGNLARFHDIETIIYAAEKLQAHTDIVFLFIGEGHKKEWARQYAASNHLSNCYFYPYVERDELGALLDCFDIGLVSLLPSQTGLSVPSKTMGLIAAEVPIIALMNAQCEIAQLLVEFQNGFVCPPENPEILVKTICHLKDHPQTLAQMKKNSHHACKNRFNITTTATTFNQIITSLDDTLDVLE